MADNSRPKSIAASIKYHELSSCIGQKIVIHGLETIEQDVLRDVKYGLPSDLQLQGEAKFWKGQLAKYAMLDLRFVLQEEIVETDFMSGKEALDYLHLGEPDAKNGFARTVLEEIEQDLAQKRWYVLLLLKTEPHAEIDPTNQLGQMSIFLKPFPEDYYPREFIVEDACLTNTSYAWFFRHFYV
jgi:hypothetical protein